MIAAQSERVGSGRHRQLAGLCPPSLVASKPATAGGDGSPALFSSRYSARHPKAGAVSLIMSSCQKIRVHLCPSVVEIGKVMQDHASVLPPSPPAPPLPCAHSHPPFPQNPLFSTISPIFQRFNSCRFCPKNTRILMQKND